MNYKKVALEMEPTFAGKAVNVSTYNGHLVVFAVSNDLPNKEGTVTTYNYKNVMKKRWYLISAKTAADFDTMRRNLIGV